MSSPGWRPDRRQRRTGSRQRGSPTPRIDDSLEGCRHTICWYGRCRFLRRRRGVRHHCPPFLGVRVVQFGWQTLVFNIRLAPAWRSKHTAMMKIGVSTYASSKFVIESLMPSAPFARVSVGSSFMPETLLSSDTRSDSSLYPDCQQS